MSSPGSRLCNVCADHPRWPLGFARCPVCNAPTVILVSQAPNRSKFAACEAQFERKYQEREERRIADGYIAPEALGKREARQIIELERVPVSDEREQVA